MAHSITKLEAENGIPIDKWETLNNRTRKDFVQAEESRQVDAASNSERKYLADLVTFL